MNDWNDDMFARDFDAGVFSAGIEEAETDMAIHDTTITPSLLKGIYATSKPLTVLAFTLLLTAAPLSGDNSAYAAQFMEGGTISAQQHIMTRQISPDFIQHAQKWQADMRITSSTSQLTSHPSYQAIIKFGKDAIPYILAELEREPAQWFMALRAITGEDPVPAADRGRVKLMAQAWIAWGKNRGYQW